MLQMTVGRTDAFEEDEHQYILLLPKICLQIKHSNPLTCSTLFVDLTPVESLNNFHSSLFCMRSCGEVFNSPTSFLSSDCQVFPYFDFIMMIMINHHDHHHDHHDHHRHRHHYHHHHHHHHHHRRRRRQYGSVSYCSTIGRLQINHLAFPVLINIFVRSPWLIHCFRRHDG